MAWPEKLVLIFLVGVAVVSGELALLFVPRNTVVIVLYIVLVIAADIWAVCRTLDWLWAGPARRRRDKVVKFSP